MRISSIRKNSKAIILSFLSLLLFPAFFALKADPVNSDHWDTWCQQKFIEDSKALKQSISELQIAVDNLKENDTTTITEARVALLKSRKAYKRLEYFMEYFFQFPVNIYNKAPVYEIEEPYMEYQSPIGFQVVEGLLFEDNVFDQKLILQEQVNALYSTASDIPATMYQFNCNEEQLFMSMNEELIRIMSLGITGYDAPVLKSGMEESGIALQSISILLQENIKEHPSKQNALIALSLFGSASVKMLQSKDFDKFDRLELMTDYLLPAQQNLLLYFRSLYPNIGKDTSVFNYKAAHLYSPDALRKDMFDKSAGMDTSLAMVRLGKKLFFEKRLSGNNRKSCASCHQPEKYFTDGLPRSKNFTENGNTVRNAPSLLYSVFQHGQFVDARDSSFEKQVYSVLQNPDEMHMVLTDLSVKLRDKEYRKLFSAAFRKRSKKIIDAKHIARALAAYERSLTPFNSAFDNYISGDKTAMTAAQKRGYNLFMGKAQCGSCHFAPIFNGCLPPLYNKTELEVLGTPFNGNVSKPLPDMDSGRYNVFKIDFYKFAFKTPTVRNSSETGPYMHNGSFKTLDDLIEFYNQGGGNGIGLNIETQTLSDKKLNLSKQEVADIKAFLESLKDKLTA